MSLLLGSAGAAYPNDDETADPFPSENGNDDYDFKYVPANRFKYIVRDVRRQRCREEEENIWASFVKQQELNGFLYDKDGVQPSIQSIRDMLDEGMKDADEQLKMLETNVLPDGTRKEYGRAGQKKRRSKVNNIRDSSPKKVPITKDAGTGSTNLLLTIPEEGNGAAYERRRQQPDDFNSHARKSRSSHAIARRRREPSREEPLLRAVNGAEYASSPESSARHDDMTDEAAVYVRPDPFAMQKIMTMRRRVCELLDEIAFRLGNIPVPDGVKDLQRRQQCVAEFAVRFSRNYLYDLNRHVKDIQRHICVISPRARIRPNHRSLGLHMHAIEHKLLAAHQLLLHALVAYCKHIPSSILKGGHPGKFKEILQVVMDLKTMCDRLQVNASYLDSGDTDALSLGKDIESKCNAILSKLKLHSDNEPPQLDSNKTPSMVSFTPHPTNSNKKRANRKQLSNRLSMYSMDTKVHKSNPKQRTNYHHQKDKKYSSIDVKRVSNESIPMDEPYPSPVTLTSKEASQTEMRKHARTYAKEEDIKTMMDTLPIESDNGSNFEQQEGHDCSANLVRRIPKASRKLSGKNLEQSETIENIIKNTSTNNNDDATERSTKGTIMEENLSNWVPFIAEFMSFAANKRNESEARPANMLMEFLQRHQKSPKSTNTKISASASCDVCRSSTGSSCECGRLETNCMSSGTRKNRENMRLICVSSSAENSSQTPRYYDASCQANCESSMKLADFEMKVKEGKRITDSQRDIELIVTEEAETSFLKYRREYQRFTQSIPMYSSNTQNKPWNIVAWIADKLVDELIMEIAKELQMDDVVQKLFELEFQEF